MSFWSELMRLDRNINADIFKGDRSETISERLGENLVKKKYGCCKWRLIICKILSWIDPGKGNHCIEAIENFD